MIWITSDTHFGHLNLREYTGRPDNADDLQLLALLRVADPKHMLLHLGDVAFGHEGLRLANLMLTMSYGSKVLVRGNHDLASIDRLLALGWNSAQDGCLISAFGKNWLFTHKPAEDCSLFDYNIHGHLHNAWSDGPWAEEGSKYILIAPEWMDYRPISLETLAHLTATPVWHGGRFAPWHQVRPAAHQGGSR